MEALLHVRSEHPRGGRGLAVVGGREEVSFGDCDNFFFNLCFNLLLFHHFAVPDDVLMFLGID